MDNVSLKKKLSSFVTDGGYLVGVTDDILYEILTAWENWTGASKEFYRSLGFSHRQMASLIGKAKKLKREGHFGEGEFKVVQMESIAHQVDSGRPSIEIVLADGRTVRFPQVDMLVDFLKKVS